MKTSIFMIVLILFITACDKKESTDGPQTSTDLKEKSKLIVQSDNVFGIEIFKKLNAVKNDSNVAISPLSITLALAMTYNGSDGETKKAFEQTLHWNGYAMQDVNTINKELVSSLLSSDSQVKLSIANSIWYDINRLSSVLPEFLDVNKKYYDAEVKNIDFSSPDAPSIINGWISDKTNAKIPKMIDLVDPDIVMFLINAIYFNGIWKYQFDKSKSIAEFPFTLQDGTSKNVYMMKQQSDFNFMENDLLQAVELPYGSGNYSMLVLLPKPNKDVNSLIAQLSTENLEVWTSSMKIKEKFVVALPRFKFEYFKRLNNSLKAMGLSNAFTSAADFSKINPCKCLYIDYVDHKSVIEVNEEGTEAAAVTVVAITKTSIGPAEPATEIIVNRPFVFAIREKTTNSILFLGKVIDPMPKE